MDVPIAKYIFTVLNSLDGWGIENVFMALGLGGMFYLVRDRQKNVAVSVLSAFFAICTVVGISYDKTGSWNCIFLFQLQFVLALFVTLGYYFLYKNSILMLGYVLERKKEWMRFETANKVEYILFEKHVFLGPFILVVLLGLPWLIAFCPGTLQWDAHAQLWMNLGAVEKTGHFPVAITELMGGCIRLGRMIFHSDSVGLFLYTFTQFMLQALTFSYGFYVMWRMRVPILIRWTALFLWTVFPFFPIWGYTMVKDTMHYIFVLLFVITLQDVLYDRKKAVKWWQIVLFICSVLGIVLTRNDGRYIVLLSLLCAFFMFRKYWRFFLAGVCTCILAVVLVEGVYMPYHNIASGPTGEMLSVPLQQTARYLRVHYEEVTVEEAEILQEGFLIKLKDVGNAYNPVISDPVKGNFQLHPDGEYLKQYFTVWFKQFCKHPDTYIQAFLNQIYGYFYPNVHNYGDYMGVFYIGNSEKWHDGYLDIEYTMENNRMRQILEHSFWLLEKVPVFCMFFSAGFHTYLLLGTVVYLLARKKQRELLVLIPCLVVLLICIASPVNAFLRYMMPIMVTLPINFAWCYAVTHREDCTEDEG